MNHGCSFEDSMLVTHFYNNGSHYESRYYPYSSSPLTMQKNVLNRSKANRRPSRSHGFAAARRCLYRRWNRNGVHSDAIRLRCCSISACYSWSAGRHSSQTASYFSDASSLLINCTKCEPVPSQLYAVAHCRWRKIRRGNAQLPIDPGRSPLIRPRLASPRFASDSSLDSLAPEITPVLDFTWKWIRFAGVSGVKASQCNSAPCILLTCNWMA